MTDPTDPGGVGAAQAERTSRTRVGDNGSPVGSPITIILAVVAVVVGFLIFRTIDSGGGNALGVAGGVTTPTAPTDTSTGVTTPGATAPGATAPSAVTPTKTGATVVVLNAARVNGAAGSVTDLLTAAGYTTEGGVTAAGSDTAATTVIQYLDATGNPATAAVAQSVAQDMGVVGVTAVPTAPAVGDGDTVGAATVFVILGTDKAGITALGAGATVTTPTAPQVAGPSTSTTTTVAG